MLIYFDRDTQHANFIFREIPFVKPQNNASTTDKWLKTMKNKRERERERKNYLVLVEFLSLVQCLEDCWHDNGV